MTPRARTPFDTYAKDLAVALLAPYGTAERCSVALQRTPVGPHA